MTAALKAEILNPFLTTGFEVIEQVLGIVKRGSLRTAPNPISLKGLAIEFRVDGFMEGIITYSMSVEVAKQIASKMLNQKINVLNELSRSCVQELANWISGNTVRRIAGANKKINLSIPRVLEGDFTVSSIEGVCLVVPALTPCGTIDIYLWLQEKQ